MANRLNEKIKSSFDKEQDRAVVAGMYAFNTTDEKWNYAQINSNGAIKVDTGSSGGGDATAANQTLQLAQETTIANDTTSIDSKITTGSDATLAFAQQVLVYGRDTGGGVDALKVDNAGHLEVVPATKQIVSTIFSGTQVIAGTAVHLFTTQLNKNGSTKFNLLISSSTTPADIDYSVEVGVSDDNVDYYADANGGGMGTPVVSQIQNAQLSIIDQTSRYARITILNNSLVNLTITSIKATRILGI